MSTPWPSGIVDPHIHLWDPFTTPRLSSREARLMRRIPTVPRGMRAVMRKADREFVGNPHHVVKPYLLADYRADAGDVPVATVVHVEAAWVAETPMDTVEETRWITGLPFGRDGLPQLGAVVVHADPRWAEVGAVLDAHLAASQLVRGVRCSAAHHPDPAVRDFEDQPGLHADAAFLHGFSAIADRGLSFELWCYSHQLPDALTLVREFPGTTFVLDHYGTPAGLFGPRGRRTGKTRTERNGLLARWRDDVAALAECPNVVAKHSGLGMPVLGDDPKTPVDVPTVDRLVDRAAPLVRHVHDCFGADRTMWASNFPMDKSCLTIPASAEIVTQVLGADAEPDKLFRDVARRTYRIQETA
jgi:predicted TIM-barrel fold metal-dependent hydrolase